MGVWDEYCLCCGLPFHHYDLPDLEELFGEDYPENFEKIIDDLPDTEWLTDVIGINKEEKMIKLGPYTAYGAFELPGGSEFHTVTNTFYNNVPQNEEAGVCVHKSCYHVVEKQFGYKLKYSDLWPILKQGSGNTLNILNYGHITDYHEQDFNITDLIKDNGEWMLENPDSTYANRNRDRIIKICKPLADKFGKKSPPPKEKKPTSKEKKTGKHPGPKSKEEICDEWRKNPDVNPKTGRKIKKDGPVYKEFVKDCDDKPQETKHRGPKSKHEICDEWRKNPLKNPKTGRAIKRDGPVYKEFVKDCDEKPVPKMSPPKPQPKPQPKAQPKPKSPRAAPKPVSPPKGPNFDQISRIYLNLVQKYPLTKRDILLKFHPDKLPTEVKEIISKHPNVGVWAGRVFDALFKLGYVSNQYTLVNAMNANRTKFDSPPHQAPPVPPKPKSPPKPAPRPNYYNPDCVDMSHLKKYAERPGPPFQAVPCAGLTKIGNDGKMYKSVPAANGVYRWVKV